MRLRLPASRNLSSKNLSAVEINQSPVPLRNRAIRRFVQLWMAGVS